MTRNWNGKAQEEEEIKLKQGDVDLGSRMSASPPMFAKGISKEAQGYTPGNTETSFFIRIVGADLLKNVPGELSMELPRHKARGELVVNGDDDRYGHKEGANGAPDILRGLIRPESVLGLESGYGQADLINLDDAV